MANTILMSAFGSKAEATLMSGLGNAYIEAYASVPFRLGRGGFRGGGINVAQVTLVKPAEPPRGPRPARRPGAYIGRKTPSVTWITPFDCERSAVTTVAVPPLSSVTTTFPSTNLAVSVEPSRVVRVAWPPP